MNAGLSNLTILKSFLLPESWQTETQLDDAIVELGLGVANQLEEYCGRKFARVVGETFECDAATMLVQLPRFPLEVLTSVEYRAAGAAVEAWDAQSGAVDQMWTSGVVQLSVQLGTSRDRLRFTYTGGYWWDQSEDESEVMPETAFELPASLRFAWQQQCAHAFSVGEMMNRRALAPSDTHPESGGVYAYNLLPGVIAALQPFRQLAG